MMQDSGCRGQGSGFRVQGSEFRVCTSLLARAEEDDALLVARRRHDAAAKHAVRAVLQGSELRL